MESLNFGYSTENIPVAPSRQYKLRLIEMTEKLIHRMRWRAFFYLNPSAKSNNNNNNFEFKSTRPPPNIRELTNFEKSITELIRTVRFRPHNNDFQTKLTNDIKQTKDSNDMLVKADKTTNYYKLTPDQYKKLADSNVTKTYKTAPENTTAQITKTDKDIATALDLDDRIEQLAQKPAFITLKDHKPNFHNKPTCRLINPTKSEIGKISKHLLENINKTLTNITGVNLWRKTTDVINWFQDITNKHACTFISFDVVDFYPSITEDLLTKALDYASNFVTITDQHKHIITHCKRAILIHNNKTWIKKVSGSNPFDVTMGSYDGAETCELVGTYLLSLLPNHIKHNIGLYRDDGLAACTENPRNTEKLKKLICATFNQHGLKITIEANKKIINFLDVTLNLNNNTHTPYTKPSNTILYVHKNSNHPPAITKNLPDNINRRLTTLSSNEHEFNKAAPPYQKALNDSGYTHKLTYEHGLSKTNNKRRNRNRNTTWYNPPYNANVQTNIGKKFINIIDTCFPKSHPLHKIFNKHTLKLSYSCMPNIKQHIDSHNKRILKNTNQENTTNKTCNCRRPADCPLNGNCLTANNIYQATVTRHDNNTDETYIGICATDFKTRYRNHKTSFTHSDKRNQTELSKHIWTLKDSDIDYTIHWKTLRQAKPYTSNTKKCYLCLTEKYYIICKPNLCTLNRRNELASVCRHRRSYLLSQFKPRRGGGATGL